MKEKNDQNIAVPNRTEEKTKNKIEHNANKVLTI